MKTPPNSIPLDAWLTRCEDFFSKQGYTSTISKPMIDEMFTLYNDRISPHEAGRACSGCRARVYKKLRNEYERLK